MANDSFIDIQYAEKQHFYRFGLDQPIHNIKFKAV